jgi:S1-C subfamily serine protease
MDRAKKPGGCPRTFLMALFGLDWSSVHGCVIGKLTPGGLAEGAGLQVGDSVRSCNGRDVSCPQSLAGAVQASFDGPTPGKLTLLIYRPLPRSAPPAPAPSPK